MQDKKILKHYLKTWQEDINRQKTNAGRKEAIFSFLKKFKRDFQPVKLDDIKSSGTRCIFVKVGEYTAALHLNINLVKLEVLP